MKIFTDRILIMLCVLMTLGCTDKKAGFFQAKIVYKSSQLVITQIADNAFLHTSFLQTQDFGKVPCNGLLLHNEGEVVVFDTPVDDKSSIELVKWTKESLGGKIKAIIPTHFHNDCLGGLKTFEENKIPSYAYFKTIALAKENNYTLPKNSFQDSLILNVGHKKIITRFFGEGHTADNVVGYFPEENILFGGCLIKEMDATKGYLGDANVNEWSNTVRRIKQAYPNVSIVVPGHGAYGNNKLLDYTIGLFSK